MKEYSHNRLFGPSVGDRLLAGAELLKIEMIKLEDNEGNPAGLYCRYELKGETDDREEALSIITAFSATQEKGDAL
jgi:hypothetical protein